MEYRRAFVERWGTYDVRFHHWDDSGRELPRPNGFPVPDGLPFRLILITHDESTFYQNNCRKVVWAQETSRPTPQPKGDGQSIMVSDFLTSEWGRLRDGDECVHCPFPPFFFTYLSSGRRGLSSRPARIEMGTLVPMISSRKSIPQSTFSKASPKAMPRPCSSLIMHLAIKNELWMQYRPGKCRKVCPFRLFFTLFSNSHRHRAEEGLDAPPRWAAYATRSAPKWRRPVVLFSGRPSLDAWLVQRDGTSHPGAWPMAS